MKSSSNLSIKTNEKFLIATVKRWRWQREMEWGRRFNETIEKFNSEQLRKFTILNLIKFTTMRNYSKVSKLIDFIKN